MAEWLQENADWAANTAFALIAFIFSWGVLLGVILAPPAAFVWLIYRSIYSKRS